MASGDGEVPTGTAGDAEAGSMSTVVPTLEPREEASLVRSIKSWKSLVGVSVLYSVGTDDPA